MVRFHMGCRGFHCRDAAHPAGVRTRRTNLQRRSFHLLHGHGPGPPIVEEFTKSLGLLVLILAARKYFDGPVDGVVFAFTIAAASPSLRTSSTLAEK